MVEISNTLEMLEVRSLEEFKRKAKAGLKIKLKYRGEQNG